MRWLALKRKDDSLERYAIGFVTHTVCKVVTNGATLFEAWRLANESIESTQLGVFRGANAFEQAKRCVENDMRERMKAA